MKKKERNRLYKTYARLYSRPVNLDMGDCAYCGSDRECLDHVPPLKWVESLDLTRFYKSGGALHVYPSCLLCNQYLGDRPLFSYLERVNYLYSRYMVEIEKREKLWSDDEIAELGYSLQMMVKGRKEYTKELIRKLRGIEKRLAGF